MRQDFERVRLNAARGGTGCDLEAPHQSSVLERVPRAGSFDWDTLTRDVLFGTWRQGSSSRWRSESRIKRRPSSPTEASAPEESVAPGPQACASGERHAHRPCPGSSTATHDAASTPRRTCSGPRYASVPSDPVTSDPRGRGTCVFIPNRLRGGRSSTHAGTAGPRMQPFRCEETALRGRPRSRLLRHERRSVAGITADDARQSSTSAAHASSTATPQRLRDRVEWPSLSPRFRHAIGRTSRPGATLASTSARAVRRGTTELVPVRAARSAARAGWPALRCSRGLLIPVGTVGGSSARCPAPAVIVGRGLLRLTQGRRYVSTGAEEPAFADHPPRPG